MSTLKIEDALRMMEYYTKEEPEDTELKEMITNIKSSNNKKMREQWDTIEGYFMVVPDPIDLPELNYKIISAKVECSFDGVKLILNVTSEDKGNVKLYCVLPTDYPAELAKIIESFKVHAVFLDLAKKVNEISQEKFLEGDWIV